MSPSQNGFFIVIDGPEGSGKSKQSKLLHDYIETELGQPCILTREPGGTVGAEEIRSLLVSGDVNRWDGITELLLFNAARRDHLEKVIKPALESGKHVICDRFIGSTYALQGYGHQLPLSTVDAVINAAIGDFKADLSIYLMVPPEIGLKRALSRRGTEARFEAMDLEFHRRVYQGFKAMMLRQDNRVFRQTKEQPNETAEQCITRIQLEIQKIVSNFIKTNKTSN